MSYNTFKNWCMGLLVALVACLKSPAILAKVSTPAGGVLFLAMAAAVAVAITCADRVARGAERREKNARR